MFSSAERAPRGQGNEHWQQHENPNAGYMGGYPGNNVPYAASSGRGPDPAQIIQNQNQYQNQNQIHGGPPPSYGGPPERDLRDSDRCVLIMVLLQASILVARHSSNIQALEQAAKCKGWQQAQSPPSYQQQRQRFCTGTSTRSWLTYFSNRPRSPRPSPSSTPRPGLAAIATHMPRQSSLPSVCYSSRHWLFQYTKMYILHISYPIACTRV